MLPVAAIVSAIICLNYITRLIAPKVMIIAKCRQRASEVLFWPGMSLDVERMVPNCSVCADFAKKQPTGPLKPTLPPSLPWQKIRTDLFEFQGEHYLLYVCYRSKFLEVTKMESLRSSVVVEELKRQFGVHGIPAEVVSDNGPQFSSSEFQEFAKEYGFKHVTSSPHYPKANGEAERAVQTVKNLSAQCVCKDLFTSSNVANLNIIASQIKQHSLQPPRSL